MKASLITGVILILLASITYGQNEVEKNLFNGIYQTSENGLEISSDELLGESLKIDSEAVISYSDVDRIEKYFHPLTNEPVIKLHLTKIGREKLRNASRANLSKPLAIFANNKLLSAPIILETISSGEVEFPCKRTDLIEKAFLDSKKSE